MTKSFGTSHFPTKKLKSSSSWDGTCAQCNEKDSTWKLEMEEEDVWVLCAKLKCPLKFHAYCTSDLKFKSAETVIISIIFKII
jgi:hypothetical protein